jgi:sugar lactone lactonase YvrE
MNISAAKTNLFRRLGCAALVVIIPTAHATVYDFAIGDPGNRTLRLNVPDGLPVVRGIVIFGNGYLGDSRNMATDPELVAFAQSMGFAVLATAQWTHFSYGYTPSEYSGWVYGLQQLATMSGHPEIVRAPWLPFGMSNGGQMSYGLNVLAPEKVIAMAINKAAIINDPLPTSAALHTPGLLVAGELDTEYRDGVRALYFSNRPRGALWAWAEEQLAAHITGDSYELILPFMAEMYAARYPAGASPQSSAVNLSSINEPEGWLTDPDSYKTGLAVIAPYATYTKDKSVAGWLPNRRLAFIFRAFASYNKATTTATVSTGTGPVDWGTTITYTIGQPVAPWTFTEFFEGDVLLKRVTSASGDGLSVGLTPATPGFSVLHALVNFADGTRRTTMPRRVFVRAGPPQAPAIVSVPDNVSARLGDTVTFSASATGCPMPACQWRKNGVNLVNSGTITGATNTTLAITNVQAGDAGSYTFVATNTVSSATSAAVQLALQDAPPTVITQPQGQTVTAGGAATFTIAASGYPAPAYQWQRRPAGANGWEDLHEGGSYHGTTTATLMVSAPTVAMSGDQFRCVTSSSAGSAASNAVALSVSGAGVLQYPVGLAADSAGNLYVADASGNTIRKITPTGVVSTLAGSTGAVGSQDGTGADARFNQPGGLTVDSAGNVYVADTGNATIRKITPAGIVTTLAGSAANRGNRDGVGNTAWFNSPSGVAVDAAGILYVADAMNATIRKITPDGTVSTLAGAAGVPGDADGVGGAARFNFPTGIATDNRQIYVADCYNHTIRRIALDGVVTTVAGSAGISGGNDGTGIYALFNQPAGVAVDPASDAGGFYVADTGNGTIRRVMPGGAVTTLAGVAGIAGFGDGTGGNALFNQPRGLVVDGNRNLWVVDTGNGAIRKVTPNGVVTTLALTADVPTPPPPSGGTTTPPGSGTATTSGGGGGGGAPSVWFCGTLLLLAAIRSFQGRAKVNGPATSEPV